MSERKRYIDLINRESERIIKIDKSYAKDIQKFNKYIEHYMCLYFDNYELEGINQIKELPYLELNIDEKIEILKDKLENSKAEKGLLGSKLFNNSKSLKNSLDRNLLIKQSILMFNKGISGLNEQINSRKNEIYIRNREKLKCIENFVIRRLFIEYAQSLILELDKTEIEIIKAFIYNIDKGIEQIKSDEDNWMLGKNLIRDMKNKIINENEIPDLTESKSIIDFISQIESKKIAKKYILEVYTNESLRNNIQLNKEIIKITEKIDLLILDFIDIISEADSKMISGILEDIKVYEYIISKLGYEEIMLKELDKLDTEICTTLESENTDKIEKDFLISKIHRKGYKSNEKVLRRTIVNVFRFTLDE